MRVAYDNVATTWLATAAPDGVNAFVVAMGSSTLAFPSDHSTQVRRYSYSVRDTDWGPSQVPPTTGLWDYISTYGYNVGSDGRKADDNENLWAETSEAQYVKPADGTVHGEWYRFAEKGDGNHNTTQYRVLGVDFDFTNTLGQVAVAGRFEVVNTASTSTQVVVEDGGNVVLPAAGGAKLIVGASAAVGTESVRVQGTGLYSGGLRMGAEAVPTYTCHVSGTFGIDDAAVPTEGWKINQRAAHVWALESTGAAWTMYLGGTSATTVGCITIDPGNGNPSMSGINVSLYNRTTKRIEINDTGMGFFASPPVSKPTGVAVTAAAIHSALVSLGLIAA